MQKWDVAYTFNHQLRSILIFGVEYVAYDENAKRVRLTKR